MLRYRVFFGFFALLFSGLLFYVAPIVNDSASVLPFLFATALLFACMSCITAFVGTFFKMDVDAKTGAICMHTTHPLYRWTRGFYKALFKFAGDVAPRYMRGREWSGLVNGCSLFWALVPLALFELSVIGGAFSLALIVWTIFTGSVEWSLLAEVVKNAWPFFVFFASLVISGIAGGAGYRKLGGLCFLVSILVVSGAAVRKVGFLALLGDFGTAILIVVGTIGGFLLSVWLAAYIYHKIPTLQQTAFGQFMTQMKKGVCPTVTPCPDDTEVKS